ncbi:MAG: polysaccharide deacetylase family protein, partial [Candidatus Paceibacterales bacterium]
LVSIFVLPKLVSGSEIRFDNQSAISKPEVIGATTSAQTVAAPVASPTPAPVVYGGYCLNVPVIFYHHIQPLAEAKTLGHAQLTVDSGIFDSQMAYLVSHGYTTISADQLAQALVNHGLVPSKSIVVSADDGYDDFYTYAYPIIQKYGLTVNLAIPTGLLNNSGYMNWDQLKQMVGSGKIFVYNHTWSHANLVGASSEKAQYEVSTAKKQLSENLDRNSDVFFYPYGNENNAAIGTIKANGYNAAFTTIPGMTQCDSFLMGLHRTRIGNSPLASYGL